ncbi:hypothetical protein [Burkholderia multivorans]|uniref:hypothetical protein n=1 Tax=Burkholderia multivorans TaxID=87883 RepID=UPI0020124744|nr:hypothetical protein [Burkholderia multivorans]
MPFLAPQVRRRRLTRNAGRASRKTIGALSDAAQLVPRLISFTDGNSKTALQHSCAGADGLRVRRKRALIARSVLSGKALAVAETSLSKGRPPARRPIAASVFHELRIDEPCALCDRATRRSRRSRRGMRCRHAAPRAGSLIVVIELRGWNGWEDC